MRNWGHAIREWIGQLDAETLNRMRIVSILMCALVFGVVLHQRTFGEVPPERGRLASTLPLSQDMVPVPSGAQARALSLFTGEGDSALLLSVEGDMTETGNESVQEASMLPVPEERDLLALPESLALSARAAILTDGPTIRSIAYQKNADARFPPASLTKLMTAVVVMEYADLADAVTISKSAVAADGAQGDLAPGETLSVLDVLRVMLVVSSNDAAAALDEYFGAKGFSLVALMNEKAQKLGMANTHFANASGLDVEGHVTSARDLAALALYSLRHQLLWDMLSKKSELVHSLDGRMTHELFSNNQLLQKEVAVVRGSKTGYTKNALGCMIAALENGSVVVVLGSGDRVGDTEKLIQLVKHD